MNFKFDLTNRDLYFTSDTHFGHGNILKFQSHNRVFDSIDEMDESLIERWNNKVKPKDVVIHGGEVSWHKPYKVAEILSRLNGQKYLIKGNHDSSAIFEFFEAYTDYAEVKLGNQNICVFHFPILEWNRRHHGMWHLHGHTHGRNLFQEIGFVPGKMLDIGIDNHPNLEPFSIEEIKERMDKIEFVKGYRLGGTPSND